MTERSQPIDKDAVEREVERIIAENIDAWRWGPLEEIEGLSEHTLMKDACRAGYLAALTQPTEQTDDAVVELVGRLREADRGSVQRALGSRIFGEAADMIEALAKSRQ